MKMQDIDALGAMILAIGAMFGIIEALTVLIKKIPPGIRSLLWDSLIILFSMAGCGFAVYAVGHLIYSLFR